MIRIHQEKFDELQGGMSDTKFAWAAKAILSAACAIRKNTYLLIRSKRTSEAFPNDPTFPRIS